jgi:hypothetical protein
MKISLVVASTFSRRSFENTITINLEKASLFGLGHRFTGHFASHVPSTPNGANQDAILPVLLLYYCLQMVPKLFLFGILGTKQARRASTAFKMPQHCEQRRLARSAGHLKVYSAIPSNKSFSTLEELLACICNQRRFLFSKFSTITVIQ